MDETGHSTPVLVRACVACALVFLVVGMAMDGGRSSRLTRELAITKAKYELRIASLERQLADAQQKAAAARDGVAASGQ